MPDESVRCGRCGSVREDGRWVRRSSDRPAAGPAGAWTRPPVPPPTPSPSPPAGAPPEVVRPGARPGCVLALTGGLAAVAALVIVIALVTAHQTAPAPSSAGWSAAYGETFEAACRATGASASYCRCAHEEAERRIPEGDMRRFQRVLAEGRSLDAGDQRTFREIETRCAD